MSKNKNKPLWQQKYSAPKEVTTAEQLQNTIRYIQNNRSKHELPEHSKDLQNIISSFCKTPAQAFKTEYKGGFDVIIGNPPYGIFLSKEEDKFYKQNYPLTNYKINLYILFIERMFQIFDKGIVHFIIPKSLLFNTYFENIRKHLLLNSKIYEIFMISEKIFPDAEVGGSLIIKYEIIDKVDTSELFTLISADSYFDYEGQRCMVNSISQDFFLSIPHYEISPVAKGTGDVIKRLNKLKVIKNFYKLKNGLNPGNIKQILISNECLSDKHKPIIWGKEFNRYSVNWGGQYINYDPTIADTLTIDDVQSKEGMKKQNRIDFALRTPDLFESEKIIVRKTGDRFIAAKDLDSLYFDTLVHGIYQIDSQYTLNFILTILNSNSATFLYRLLHDIKGKVFAKISLDKLSTFPLPSVNVIQMKSLETLGIKMSSMQPNFNNILLKFVKYFSSKYHIYKVSRKLQNWHELDFGDFTKEINKAIKANNKLRIKEGLEEVPTLTKKDEFEWLELFEDNKQKAQALQTQISQTDKEIDAMVYELYGLTKEEIAIVEDA